MSTQDTIDTRRFIDRETGMIDLRKLHYSFRKIIGLSFEDWIARCGYRAHIATLALPPPIHTILSRSIASLDSSQQRREAELFKPFIPGSFNQSGYSELVDPVTALMFLKFGPMNTRLERPIKALERLSRITMRRSISESMYEDYFCYCFYQVVSQLRRDNRKFYIGLGKQVPIEDFRVDVMVRLYTDERCIGSPYDSIAIEFDEDYHSTPRVAANDQHRDKVLAARGIRTVRVKLEELHDWLAMLAISKGKIGSLRELLIEYLSDKYVESPYGEEYDFAVKRFDELRSPHPWNYIADYPSQLREIVLTKRGRRQKLIDLLNVMGIEARAGGSGNIRSVRIPAIYPFLPVTPLS